MIVYYFRPDFIYAKKTESDELIFDNLFDH